MDNDRIYYSHEGKMQALRFRTIFNLMFLGIGFIIGTVLALLFAPSTGKKTREEFAKNVQEGLQTGRETIEPMVKRAEKEFAEIQKNIEEKLPQS